MILIITIAMIRVIIKKEKFKKSLLANEITIIVNKININTNLNDHCDNGNMVDDVEI